MCASLWQPSACTAYSPQISSLIRTLGPPNNGGSSVPAGSEGHADGGFNLLPFSPTPAFTWCCGEQQNFTLGSCLACCCLDWGEVGGFQAATVCPALIMYSTELQGGQVVRKLCLPVSHISILKCCPWRCILLGPEETGLGFVGFCTPS